MSSGDGHSNMTVNYSFNLMQAVKCCLISVPFCAGKSYGVEVVWMDSTTDEANLWQRMLQSDGEWVENVLPLRMLEMANSMSK